MKACLGNQFQRHDFKVKVSLPNCVFDASIAEKHERSEKNAHDHNECREQLLILTDQLLIVVRYC